MHSIRRVRLVTLPAITGKPDLTISKYYLNIRTKDTGLRSASLYSAGWSAEKMGQADAAIESYSQAVESFPRSDQAPLCLLRIARINYEQQKVKEAIDAYRAITESYQETRYSADAFYGLGILYRDEGRADEGGCGVFSCRSRFA